MAIVCAEKLLLTKPLLSIDGLTVNKLILGKSVQGSAYMRVILYEQQGTGLAE